MQYNKPAIPKGTSGKLRPLFSFRVGFQRVTKFWFFSGGRFSVVSGSFLGYIWAHFGAFRYMFQQIFSK